MQTTRADTQSCSLRGSMSMSAICSLTSPAGKMASVAIAPVGGDTGGCVGMSDALRCCLPGFGIRPLSPVLVGNETFQPCLQ